METDWNALLLAYLHDPPDKALDIPGHIARARRYAAVALGRAVTEEEMRHVADQVASAVERLPMPTAGSRGERVAGLVNGSLLTVHPLSAKKYDLSFPAVDEKPILRVIQEVSSGIANAKIRFLSIWRLLPERLSSERRDLGRLPADTRTPDHTIWQHLDITAAFKATEGKQAAFLSFSIGPVQTFIATAKTVRDLWSGSMILSWVTFQAMLPIVDQLGPTALVYPVMRGMPFLDYWLKEKGVPIDPRSDLLCAPCIPNRFLALVPWGPEGALARELSNECQRAARDAWHRLASAIRNKLDTQMNSIEHGANWAQRWEEQIDSFFDIQTAVLPLGGAREEVDGRLADLITGKKTFAEAFPDAEKVRAMARAIQHPPGYDQENAGRWQYHVELSARLMQAQRAIRHVPALRKPDESGEFPPKCSLMGTYEQMGPANLANSRAFWEQAQERIRLESVRLRDRERLCAVAMVKRFCGPAFFRGELGLRKKDLRYEDTATVAAAEWLEGMNFDPTEIRESTSQGWSGQWLHWPTHDFDKDHPCPNDLFKEILAAREKRKPPAYYAILKADGDDMGGWLRGDKSPTVREVMHPDLAKYFDELGEEARKGLEAHRPVGPALHAAISEALANFALHFVPEIIDKHRGALIYAGGDDVLALLPARLALACAHELRNTFSADWQADKTGTNRLLMGSKATLSAGIAIVHYKEDLRFALEAARNAEKAAKNAGRDALQITVCRRSGEHSSALCPWEFIDPVEAWVEAFSPKDGKSGASDRWAYHLRGELPTLEGLETATVRSEIRRQVDRAEEPTRQLLGRGDKQRAGEEVARAFDRYCDLLLGRKGVQGSRVLRDFIVLCQTASFLARGRDE